MNIVDFTLPPSVVTKLDILNLVAELERIDNEMTSASIRANHGGTVGNQPDLSETMIEFLSVNQLQIGDSKQRSRLIAEMRKLKNTAPTIHMTFAAAADPASIKQIVSWLRESIHPQSVVTIGLQPDLIGGIYLRTANKVFDLSVRAQLAGSRHLLVESVEALSGDK